MNGKAQRLELIVGAFVLAGLALLCVLIIFFSRAVEFGRHYYNINAEFTNVRGMAPGTPVRYMGIDVGRLRSTKFADTRDKVILVLRIYGEYNIPANAKLTIRPEGLLGDYYLEFYGGNMEKEYLSHDGTAGIKGETSASLDEIATKLSDFTTKLDGVLDNLQVNLTSLAGRINKILDDPKLQGNLSAIFDGLAQTLGDKDFQKNLRGFAEGLSKTLGDEKFQADIKAAAADAPDAVKSFKEMSDRMTKLADRADEVAGKLKTLTEKLDTQVDHQGENFDKITADLHRNAEALNQTLGSLEEIFRNINAGKGTVGELVTKDELHKKLVKAIDSMNEALNEISRMADAIKKRWGG